MATTETKEKKKMTGKIRQSFTMEDECGVFLANFKRKYKIPKSAVVNCLLKYYMNNPNKLLALVIGEENGKSKK